MTNLYITVHCNDACATLLMIGHSLLPSLLFAAKVKPPATWIIGLFVVAHIGS